MLHGRRVLKQRLPLCGWCTALLCFHCNRQDGRHVSFLDMVAILADAFRRPQRHVAAAFINHLVVRKGHQIIPCSRESTGGHASASSREAPLCPVSIFCDGSGVDEDGASLCIELVESSLVIVLTAAGDLRSRAPSGIGASSSDVVAVLGLRASLRRPLSAANFCAASRRAAISASSSRCACASSCFSSASDVISSVLPLSASLSSMGDVRSSTFDEHFDLTLLLDTVRIDVRDPG